MISLILIGQFLAVFIATFIADVCWTKYFLEVGKHRELPAANWSAAIIAIGAFTVISYTINHWLTLAAIFGSWFGTWWTVRRERLKAAEKALDDAIEINGDYIDPVLLNEQSKRPSHPGGGPDE